MLDVGDHAWFLELLTLPIIFCMRSGKLSAAIAFDSEDADSHFRRAGAGVESHFIAVVVEAKDPILAHRSTMGVGSFFRRGCGMIR